MGLEVLSARARELAVLLAELETLVRHGDTMPNCDREQNRISRVNNVSDCSHVAASFCIELQFERNRRPRKSPIIMAFLGAAGKD